MFGSNNSEVKKAIQIVKRAAAGDFEARITNIQNRGDLGELFNAINDLIDRNDAYVRESVACMEKVRDNRYYPAESWKPACRERSSRQVNL